MSGAVEKWITGETPALTQVAGPSAVHMQSELSTVQPGLTVWPRSWTVAASQADVEPVTPIQAVGPGVVCQVEKYP